ncbi:MAG: hypothetical protein A3D87_06345 [Omnitrophica WOR_2 bacterium RIFCSPHIGHO2_02_FULL_50_17]|nr:MAG: hypothetical protein A3D87_06345 [Omnitrophica WOR_2 bacterium RIFCSPHIGHO2_02_FULL_50_17]
MGKTVLWTCLSLLCFFSSAFAGTITGHVECPGARTNPWAVVYVDQMSGREFSPPAEHALMDQVAKEFVPHVLPVLKGTTVDFRNSDPFKHNVFSPDEAADEFNLGSWGQGEKRSYTFPKTGEAVMLCDLHPEMEGWIVVLPTPYFAVTDGNGNYAIKDVPAGAYTLKTWHKKLKPAEAQVTVSESGESKADFTLKK